MIQIADDIIHALEATPGFGDPTLREKALIREFCERLFRLEQRIYYAEEKLRTRPEVGR